MELTEKILINNEKEAQDFIDSWNNAKVYNSLSVKDFVKYPALLSYYEDDFDYTMSYTATAYYSITYLDDFEDQIYEFLDYLNYERSDAYELGKLEKGYLFGTIIEKFEKTFNYE